MTGQGVAGTVDGRKVAVGNVRFMQSFGVETGGLVESLEARRRKGQTVVFAAVDGVLSGIIGVADPVKSTAREAIDQLHHQGLNVSC